MLMLDTAPIVHGPCIIHKNVTIGMGSIICTGCEMEEGSLLTSNQVIPANKLAMGSPAKVVKDVSEQQVIIVK